jgi:hypothetical protein
MNEIIKFTDYKKINENVIIPVVDVVIGNTGVLKYRGDLPLKGIVKLKSTTYTDEKGGVVLANLSKKSEDRGLTQSEYEAKKMVVSQILGQDGREYPGGLDKNGKLVGVHFDSEGNLLTKAYGERGSKKIELPNTEAEVLSTSLIRTDKLKYWNKDVDYIKCVPSTPTGWVNVKVDMEVIKRVRRYSAGLVNPDKISDNSHEEFVSKLKALSEISNKDKNMVIANIDRSEIQRQMSAIILLHYVNEIKTFFTPSTSGLLFESFLGGLIPFAKVTEDNGKADISVPVAGVNIEYQVKLYSENSTNVSIALKGKVQGRPSVHPNGEIPLDYYLICIKRGDMIDIYILDDDIASKCYYNRFRSGNKKNDPNFLGNSNTFSLSELLKNSSTPGIKYTLNLSDLEGKINIIGKSIKRNLDYLYKQLSEFQYNVETIITGVDEKSQKVIEDEKFTKISKDAGENLAEMTKVLSRLVKGITKKPKV